MSRMSIQNGDNISSEQSYLPRSDFMTIIALKLSRVINFDVWRRRQIAFDVAQ